MATQKGLYKVRGTMDDSSFYKSRDGFIVRMKSSLTKERIMTDPRFENLQRQMKEFGGAGKAALLFRNAINPIMGKFKDGRLSSRFTKLMSAVVKGDSTSALGLRNVTNGDLSMFFDTLRRRFTCVQLHYTHLIPFRYLLAQTLNTIPFEYSTFGWFANNICILYATGRLSSPIDLSKKVFLTLISGRTKRNKKIKPARLTAVGRRCN